MSTKKIIVIIILLTGLLAWFMNYAFRKIQTVELEIEISTSDEININLLEIIEELDVIKDVTFVGEVTISDMPILLVDHLNNQAVLWKDETYMAIDYKKLDKTIINSNSYMAYIFNKPTLVLNCDPILGDTVERAVILSHQHLLGNITSLNPSEVNYFLKIDDDITTNYYRYEMIESMKKAYFQGTSLEEFGYYYNKWAECLGGKHMVVADYDYYDGLEMYLTTQVRENRDSDFDLETFINNKTNYYGIYDKNNTYPITGLLWFLLAEREGIDVLTRDDVKSDRYKILLKGVPYVNMDDHNEFVQYEKKYVNYIEGIKEMITNCENYIKNIEPVSLSLISERYGETIQIDQNLYIYTNYLARLDNLELIQEDYVIAYVEPYRIRYYLDY